MTAQILSSELANLVQESKRKHADLRNVSYSLWAKSILVRNPILYLPANFNLGGGEIFGGAEGLEINFGGSNSCGYIPKIPCIQRHSLILLDLSARPNFVTPFLIACGTKSVKFTGIAIVCLQRLVVSRALPRSRLREVLDAFRESTSAGLDVQLKILQALPSLLQNYADDLKAELLAAALNICTILQASKNGIVNNTAAATLQQLVVSVFDKVVDEDSEFNSRIFE